MVQGSPIVAALVLILMAALVTPWIVGWPAVMPWSAFVPVVVLAGLFLPPRWLAVVLLVIAGLLAYAAWSSGGTNPSFPAPSS